MLQLKKHRCMNGNLQKGNSKTIALKTAKCPLFITKGCILLVLPASANTRSIVSFCVLIAVRLFP